MRYDLVRTSDADGRRTVHWPAGQISRRTARWFASVLLISASIGVCSAPAMAGETPPDPPAAADKPGTILRLTMEYGGTAPDRTVVLRCEPPGGTHPNAAAACRDLMKSRGKLGKLPGTSPRPCPMIHAPVKVTAEGHLDDDTIMRYQAAFPNDCLLSVNTGALFDF